MRIGERVWEDLGSSFYDDMEAGAAYWVQQGARARLVQQTDAQSPTHYWTLTGESSGDAVLELGGSITIPGVALQPHRSIDQGVRKRFTPRAFESFLLQYPQHRPDPDSLPPSAESGWRLRLR